MARPKATPEQREEIRDGIRKAAAEIYNSEGITAISARAVAAKAGVSVGAIYAHFGDLTGLMQSLWIPHVERQGQAFRALAAQHEDPAPRLQALLRAYLQFGIDNADLYKGALMFVRPAKLPRPVPAPLSSYDFPALLTDTIRDGQASGQFIPADPAQLAQMLWSGVHGCLALPVNIDRAALASVEEMTGLMVDALMRSVLTSPA